MNFDALYKQVFITEQDEVTLPPTEETPTEETPAPEAATTDATPGVASPDNYDVEPAPVVTPAGDAGTLKTFLSKLDEFAESLNGVDGDSLQKLVNDLDRPGSLFQGISREVSSDIIKLAEQTAGLAEIIKGFIINSAKRARDLSSSNSTNA